MIETAQEFLKRNWHAPSIDLIRYHPVRISPFQGLSWPIIEWATFEDVRATGLGHLFPQVALRPANPVAYTAR